MEIILYLCGEGLFPFDPRGGNGILCHRKIAGKARLRVRARAKPFGFAELATDKGQRPAVGCQQVEVVLDTRRRVDDPCQLSDK